MSNEQANGTGVSQNSEIRAYFKPIGKILIGLIIGFLIARIQPPTGLTVPAMKLIGIFACTIIWLIIGAMPEFVASILMCVGLVIFAVVPITSAFSGFAGDTVWLVIGALGMAVGLSKSGLLKRVCLIIMKLFQDTFKGQVLAFLTAGTIIAPIIPSLTAKVSLAAPFARQTAELLGFKNKSKGPAGIFSAMFIPFGCIGHVFLTGSAYSFMILGLLPPAFKSQFTWWKWLASAAPWGIAMVVLSYFAIMFLYKPDEEQEINKDSKSVSHMLAEMGPMNFKEIISALVLVFAVVLWTTERIHGMPAAMVAVIALCIMMFFKLFDHTEFRSGIPWDLVVFMGTFISIAGLFSPMKIDKWVGGILTPYLGSLFNNVFLLVIVLAIVIYLVRFVIISQISTLTIFTVALTPLAVQAGINPWIIGFASLSSIIVWNLSFHNTTFMAAFGASGGEMATHKQLVKMSYAYMIINIIGLLLCVPFWKMMGMIP